MVDLNPLPLQPAARQPRGAVKVAGVTTPGWLSWEVENNVFRAADTFRVSFAASLLPAARDIAWFTTQTEIVIEIFATDSPADPTNYAPTASDRIIYGQVDDIDYHPVSGTLELTGRDLTARLIDTRISVNNSNQTSSEIAAQIAGKHGLTPVVTATSARVGTYYAADHVDVSQQQSEWETLVKLADYEGFDVFVKGDELHFEPKPAEGTSHYALVWTPPTADTAHPTLNAVNMTLSRSLTIAKGVTVEVRSWNAKQKKAFTSAWPRQVKPVRPGASTNENQTYRFSFPGLTQDQALARAQKLYGQIVQHMVKLNADMPGDAILDCTKTIMLRGTATGFDQVYFPDSVRRSMSMDEGYRMSVTAKNISQDIEAAAS